MARMSIDDMIARDTRIDRLAKLCGWSRRETRACLEDVWALCYDRIVPYLPAEDIEVTAARDAIAPVAYPDGFVAALRVVGLARDATTGDRLFVRKDGTRLPWPDQQWRDRVYLAGAAERVGYLLGKKSAGQQGGVKSGQSRRSKTKQSFASASSESQASRNPPDPVPDLVPEIPEISPARAIPPSTEPVAPPRTEPATLTLAQRQKINADVWAAARAAHEQLRAAGVDRHAQAWTAMPTGVGGSELAARTKELSEQLMGNETAVRELHMRVIAVRTEEAKRQQREGKPSPLEYFIPTRVFEASSFWKSAELTPEQAAQPRRAPAMRLEPRELRVVRDDRDDTPPDPMRRRA